MAALAMDGGDAGAQRRTPTASDDLCLRNRRPREWKHVIGGIQYSSARYRCNLVLFRTRQPLFGRRRPSSMSTGRSVNRPRSRALSLRESLTARTVAGAYVK